MLSSYHNKVQLLICPNCRTNIYADSISAKCENGHSFEVVDGIVNIMPEITDQNLLHDEQFWINTAKAGWPDSIEDLNP